MRGSGTALAGPLPVLSLVVLLALVTPSSEVARLDAHFTIVERELEAANTSALTSEQRARRAKLIDDLERYRRRGSFPRNLAFPDPTPLFIDDRGVRCAMAQLIEWNDGADLVARVADTANTAYVRELAADPAFLAWLDAHGLSVAEAARIQPSYPAMAGYRCDGFRRCSDGAVCEPTLDDPPLAFCSPPCDPAASNCPIGIDGNAMACEARGDRFLCVYPLPSPGSLGWPCNPTAIGICPENCVQTGDRPDVGVCTPSCSNERSCPTGYACENPDPTVGADYLRACRPVDRESCSAGGPAGLLLVLLVVPLAYRRRVAAITKHSSGLQASAQ